MTKNLIIRTCFLPLIFLPLSILGMRDTPLGQLDFSASLTGIYDSRVFGISEDLFNKSRNGNNGFIKSDELESQDDFILKFSPAVHFNRKISLLRFAGSAGVEIAQIVCFLKRRTDIDEEPKVDKETEKISKLWSNGE